ncbi:MAG: GNAT family N-acetyltransferase [candidate division Zixibacteria bacterium]|nr:GNAT family N-acetyltransferase [candidate division Zixibacteria bacterium]
MLSIRAMKKEDIDNVSELLCSSYRYLAQTENYSKSELDFLLTKRGSVETIERESQIQNYIVAFEGEILVGMAAIEGCEITKLYVHPEWHRNGIGRQLFNYCKNEIFQEGHKELKVIAIGESTLPFYIALGMHEFERKKCKIPAFASRIGIYLQMALY